MCTVAAAPGAASVRVWAIMSRCAPSDGATPPSGAPNALCVGYAPEAFRGGWFHSGDIGVWHPDGYIELRDRKKDIIISGGENISTIEVEQCVAKHPAVMECAVVAIPDEKWGERPKAFVTLKPGQQATEKDIIEFCKQHIAHFKAPAAIEFGNLPKTSTGKVQKFVLRDKEWKGREKRIN
jgi:fatty-acyl-CoA synthase